MKIMKSLLLALSLALALPVYAAEPVTKKSSIKLAKKKDRKPSLAKKLHPRKNYKK